MREKGRKRKGKSDGNGDNGKAETSRRGERRLSESI